MSGGRLNSRGESGKRGEDVALSYLQKRGLILIDRNWRSSHREIDLIMSGGARIHFIEVRSRSTNFPLNPYETINYEKKRNIIKAAASYLKIHKINREAVFGVVSVIFEDNRPIRIDYFEDAFSPGWR